MGKASGGKKGAERFLRRRQMKQPRAALLTFMQLYHCVVSAHRGVVCAFDSAVCLYSFEMAQIKRVECVSVRLPTSNPVCAYVNGRLHLCSRRLVMPCVC